MYIEDRGWAKAQILLTNCWYIEKCRLVGIITSIQSSVFNFPFQIVIYHPILSNNCKNVFAPVLLLYSDTPGVALEEGQPYIA